MAEIYLSCCAADAEFARRVGLDLHSLGFTCRVHQWESGADSLLRSLEAGLSRYCYFAPVISAAALEPPWSIALFNQSLGRAVTEFGAELLPVRKDASGLPSAIDPNSVADFSNSYDEGLAAIWGRLTAVRTAVVSRLPSFEVWLGWRGPQLVEGARRNAMFSVAQTEEMISVAVLEGAGAPAFSAELVSVLENRVRNTLEAPGIKAMDAVTASIRAANWEAIDYRKEFGIADQDGLAASIAVACIAPAEGWLATAGAPSALVRHRVGEDTQIYRFQSKVEGRLEMQDVERARAILATPIGYLNAESGIQKTPLPILEAGDFVALVTWPLAAYAAEFEEFAVRISGLEAPREIVEAFVNLHRPASEEALCALLLKT